MAENKFIKRLHGKETAKSVVEIKNTATPTMFTNMPAGDSNVFNTYSDHRGNATGVLRGTDNWKLSGTSLVQASTVYGDGRDMTGAFVVGNAGLWIDATYTFAEPKLFTPNTEWVLKLCGNGLLSDSNDTVELTMLIKFGSTMVSKTFFLPERSFSFSEELVIDFSESIAQTIKVNAGDTMVVQVLCGDSSAQAQIYNGMTVLTALQRRVDAETVASDKKTFDEVVQDIDDINDEIVQIHEDIDDLEEYVDDTFVRLDGNSIMTGPLKMRATSSFQCAIAPFWDGVGFYKLNSDDSVTLIASIETPDGFVPWVTNTYNIGSSLKKWKNLYLSGKAYVSVINNGYDIAVPVTNSADTLALKSEVDLAANSGRMITDQGVWYAKMYAATVAPSAENDTNYADFSQVDGQGNPIIVIYERQNGAWVQSETITPPAEYDGYVPITSKIWDITEQAGQQGGRILWNHQSKEFTPYPQIVSFEDIEITGNSTVVMPQTPSTNQIVNKYYVDYAISNAIGNGTITITQGGTTKGIFTTNQGGNTTIDLDSGGAGHNVGDVFFTMRNDNELNGAVVCDGSTYNTTDFTGTENIGALLVAGKIPYVSLADYATALATNGSVGVFGWDGTNTTAFRVPLLNDIFVETGTATQIGDCLKPGLPNLSGSVNVGMFGNPSGTGVFTGASASYNWPLRGTYTEGYGGNVPFNASNGNSIYGNSTTVQPNAVRYRAMVQLAVSTTDEALETCTSVLADVANLKDHRVIAFQAPTAQNNYTWYRLYADGWVEQGGRVDVQSVPANTSQNISLPVTMVDDKYAISLQEYTNSTNISNENANYIYSQTTTGFAWRHTAYGGNTQTMGVIWQVSGMAQG